MSKTPFEIRMELLNFAQSQLTGQYYSELERVRESTIDHSRERKEAIANIKYPTQEDIIELANTLKTFVDSK